MGVNQKRLEYQLYLARENPEPTFDVSKCNLVKIPQGCYTLCKVLRKKILDINTNKIKDLISNGNNIADLVVLTHIYAQHNEITNLPDNIITIQYLQILDISHNQLTSLPSSMGKLIYLRKLYLQSNNIKYIPSGMLTSQSALELINISENKAFSSIPESIFKLEKLRKFSFTHAYLNYPSRDVCKRGVLEILKVLCQDAGVKMTDSLVHTFSDDITYDDVDSRSVDSSALDYESFKQKRLNFLESIEGELYKSVSSQGDLRDKAMKDKSEFLDQIANEELRIMKEISFLHLERDLRREQLVHDVKAAEIDAHNLIEEIMTVNKAFKTQEKILDELEKDTNKKYQVYQEDYKRLRKAEILNVMSEMLTSQDSADDVLRQQLASKENLKENISRSNSLTDESITELLKGQQDKRMNLCNEIERQEFRQKIAFQQLQLEKDSRTLRIKQQITSIESELIILSQVEQNKRSEKNCLELRILNERRADLVKLLEVLLNEKHLREKDLLNKLREIEQQRKANQVDFWLVQYQRLLDTKPPDFLNDGSDLSILVLEAINRANAMEYLPFIQRHGITWDQLENFQESDLRNIGIHDSVKISDIISAVSQLRQQRRQKMDSFSIQESPTRPMSQTTFSRTAITVTSHKESECCICMVDETTMLFLECGHICCCEKCSENLSECPLCRQSITRFIKLMGV